MIGRSIEGSDSRGAGRPSGIGRGGSRRGGGRRRDRGRRCEGRRGGAAACSRRVSQNWTGRCCSPRSGRLRWNVRQRAESPHSISRKGLRPGTRSSSRLRSSWSRPIDYRTSAYGARRGSARAGARPRCRPPLANIGRRGRASRCQPPGHNPRANDRGVRASLPMQARSRARRRAGCRRADTIATCLRAGGGAPSIDDFARARPTSVAPAPACAGRLSEIGRLSAVLRKICVSPSPGRSPALCAALPMPVTGRRRVRRERFARRSAASAPARRASSCAAHRTDQHQLSPDRHSRRHSAPEQQDAHLADSAADVRPRRARRRSYTRFSARHRARFLESARSHRPRYRAAQRILWDAGGLDRFEPDLAAHGRIDDDRGGQHEIGIVGVGRAYGCILLCRRNRSCCAAVSAGRLLERQRDRTCDCEPASTALRHPGRDPAHDLGNVMPLRRVTPTVADF